MSPKPLAPAVPMASKVNGAHVHEHEGGRAHDAWLHRHVKLALRQQRFQPARFRAEGGVAQVVEGNDLGVPRRVLLDVGAVVASSHDGPVVHYDAADRHLILVQCTLRLQKGRAHECVLLQGEGRRHRGCDQASRPGNPEARPPAASKLSKEVTTRGVSAE